MIFEEKWDTCHIVQCAELLYVGPQKFDFKMLLYNLAQGLRKCKKGTPNLTF